MLRAQPKQKAYRNPKILKACKDDDVNCTVELPGCSGPGAPTVPAHSNRQGDGKGRGIKADDCFVAAACDYCHKVLDGQVRLHSWNGTEEGREMPREELDWYHDRGIKRTIRIMLDKGVLK